MEWLAGVWAFVVAAWKLVDSSPTLSGLVVVALVAIVVTSRKKWRASLAASVKTWVHWIGSITVTTRPAIEERVVAAAAHRDEVAKVEVRLAREEGKAEGVQVADSSRVSELVRLGIDHEQQMLALRSEISQQGETIEALHQRIRTFTMTEGMEAIERERLEREVAALEARVAELKP